MCLAQIILPNTNDDLSFESSEIRNVLSTGSYDDLPEPLRPKLQLLPKHTMDLHYVSNENGKKIVVQHILFETGVNPAWVKDVFSGHNVDLLFVTRGQIHPKQCS